MLNETARITYVFMFFYLPFFKWQHTEQACWLSQNGWFVTQPSVACLRSMQCAGAVHKSEPCTA